MPTLLPLAKRGTPWSKSEAIPLVRKLTGSESAPSASYHDAFFLVEKDGKEFGDYHLPFATVENDKLVAVPRAIFAAAAAIQGARSGASLPDGAAEKVKKDVEAYYSKMAKEFEDDSIVAPWLKSDKEEHSKTLSGTRDFVLDEIRADKSDDRRITLSFSSENPVNTQNYDNEVLSHDEGAADLSRLNSAAPLLFQHQPAQQIGVVERAWIDSLAKKGRAIVRFSKNQLANEIFQDVLDGIRKNVSFGFDFEPATPTLRGDKMVNLIKRWIPSEISLVSVPADTTVGVSRSKQIADNSNSINNYKEAGTNASQTILTMSTEPVISTSAPDLKSERNRVASINKIADSLAKDVANVRELARHAVENGLSESEFCTKLFAEMESQGKATRATKSDAEIGLTKREAQGFSFHKLINSQANASGATKEAAKFELEVCDAYRGKMGNVLNNLGGFMIPNEVLTAKRELSAVGSDIVATNLLAQDFIELLRNQVVVEQAGAMRLDGLVGNVNIPSQTGAAVAYWLSTDTTPLTESDQVFSNIALTPHTLTGYTSYSRQLLAQSTPAIENLVRNDLALQLAIGIDEAAINGTGTAGQPKGILNQTGISIVALGTNGAAPTYQSIVDLKGALMKANAYRGSLAFLQNGQVWETLTTTPKIGTTYPVFVQDPESKMLIGEKVFNSQQIPSNLVKGTGTNLSATIFGNFRDLVVAGWGGLEILVDPYTAASNNGVNVYAYQMVDIAVRHAASFAAIVDMITT